MDVKTSCTSPYQKVLRDYLEGLCVDNGVDVFQQWDVFARVERCTKEITYCRCSHWCRDVWCLVNVFNGQLASPIGSVCIQRWFGGNGIQESMKRELKEVRRKKKREAKQRQQQQKCLWPGCGKLSSTSAVCCSACAPAMERVGKWVCFFPKHKGTPWCEVVKKDEQYVKWVLGEKGLLCKDNAFKVRLYLTCQVRD